MIDSDGLNFVAYLQCVSPHSVIDSFYFVGINSPVHKGGTANV